MAEDDKLEIRAVPGVTDNWNMPMRKWRCTRGHTWEAPFSISFLGAMSIPDLGIEAEPVCAKCAHEWLREYCGKVREVK